MPAHLSLSRCRVLLLLGGLLLPAGTRADDLGDGRFREEVAGVLRAIEPGARILPDPDPARLRVDSRAVERTLALTNLHSLVGGQTPAERRRTIESHLNGAFRPAPGAPPNGHAQSFAQAKARLRVQLVPPEMLRQSPNLVHRTFSDTLIVAYVLDEPKRYQYVTREMLADWGVEAGALEPVAVANLAAASKDAPFNVALADGKPAIAMATAGDDYDAARLMLPRYLESIRDALKAEVITLAAPNRNLLMAWPSGSPARRALAAEVRNQLRTGPYGRSDELFRFDRDGLRPLNAAERADNGR